jgi:hypothetical protein
MSNTASKIPRLGDFGALNAFGAKYISAGIKSISASFNLISAEVNPISASFNLISADVNPISASFNPISATLI